jgi:hypothetical protein
VKTQRFAVVIASCGLGASCASSSGVFQDSADTYRIATRATWELGGRAGAIKMALKEATEYCAKKNAGLKVISSNGDYSHFEGGTVDMRFRCENSPTPSGTEKTQDGAIPRS